MPRILPDWPGFEADTEFASLVDLSIRLAAEDGPADERGTWPDRLWSMLGASGAARWAQPADRTGGFDRPALMRRYAKVAEGSLTAAFILSQHDAAVRRLAPGRGRPVADRWLEAIASGRAFATVGISQLTTSRRHGPAALLASATGGGYRLDGRHALGHRRRSGRPCS